MKNPMSFKMDIDNVAENKLFFFLHRLQKKLSYVKINFPIHLYRLSPMTIHLININNDIIIRDLIVINKLIAENASKPRFYPKTLNVHYIYKRKALFNIYNTYVNEMKAIEKEVDTLIVDSLERDVEKLSLNIWFLLREFWDLCSFVTLSKCTSLVLYKGYYVLNEIKHYFHEGLDYVFYIKDKFKFNKLWLKDQSLDKYVLAVPAHTIRCKGYSLKNRKVYFNNGKIENKFRFLYHKYDFDNEIKKLRTDVSSLWLDYFCIKSEILRYNGISFIDIFPNTSVIPYVKPVTAVAVKSPKRVDIRKIKDLPILRFDDLLFDTLKGCYSIFDSLVSIREKLTSINVDIGYIINTDVFNCKYYPVICDVISLFIDKDSYSKLNNHFKISIYKWSINILFINMYKICEKMLSRLSLIDIRLANLEDVNSLKILISKLETFSGWCYSMMDNSIKQHLIRKHVSIFSDIISGFDTEFVAEDWNQNTLLSSQISSSHVLKLSVPLYKSFTFEGVNTLTSETYLKSTPKFNNISHVLKFISEQISESRIYKFKSHDFMTSKIASHFYNDPTVKNVSITNRGIDFAFDKASIKNLFVLASKDEKLELSFQSLINLITSRFDKRTSDEDLLIQKILDIDYSLTSSSSFEPRNDVSWDGATALKEEIEDLELSNDSNKKLSKINYSGAYSSKVHKFSLEENFSVEKSPEEMSSALEESSPLIKGELGGLPLEKSPEEIFWNPVTAVMPIVKNTLQINVKRRIYLAAHYNSADLTLLKDWKDVSLNNIDIVKKCFTSLSIPFKYGGKESVYLRDTMLLASATARSLSALAHAYNMNKKELPQEYLSRMNILLKEFPEVFKEYAMTDSLITVIHTLFINDFSFKLGSLSIPNTLGTLSSKYIKNKWREDKYRGYQIDVNYPIGDVRPSHTPKGIQFGQSTLEMNNLFIGSYRGGRNECFKYGIDRSKKWFDYDLASCYSTIMGMLGQPEYEMTDPERLAAVAENIMPMMGHPDYSKGMWIHPTTDLKKLNLLDSYSAFKIKFCLPKEIKYPPFPVTLDESITIYPSSGITLVTGTELYVGKRILNSTLDRFSLSPKDYYIEILYGSYIPFKKTYDKESKTEALAYSPFYDVINELQENRRIWKKKTGKGSAMERIYKDLGNMLYGKIVCGISNKKVYDSRKDQMKTMLGNDLANPIIGTWITGCVRALIAELLHKVELLGGDVISCTTDGFVCDIENLENTIIESFEVKNTILEKYRNIRINLSGDASALEVKTSVKGIIQWTTRGQLSLESIPNEYDKMIPISAATGYQKVRDHQENVNVVEHAMSSNNKVLFLQKQLTGALDLYKTGSHVSMKSSQRTFRTIFDSKRFVVPSELEMKDTRPFIDTTEALLHRQLMNSLKTSVFSDEYSVSLVKPSKNSIEELIKYYVRMLCMMKDYNIDDSLKTTTVSLLKFIDKNINEKFVLNLFSHYELNKGTLVTKLPLYNVTEDFVYKLYMEIETISKHSKTYKEILEQYLVFFDNFYSIKKFVEENKTLRLNKDVEYIKNNMTINNYVIRKTSNKLIVEISL